MHLVRSFVSSKYGVEQRYTDRRKDKDHQQGAPEQALC